MNHEIFNAITYCKYYIIAKKKKRASGYYCIAKNFGE